MWVSPHDDDGSGGGARLRWLRWLRWCGLAPGQFPPAPRTTHTTTTTTTTTTLQLGENIPALVQCRHVRVVWRCMFRWKSTILLNLHTYTWNEDIVRTGRNLRLTNQLENLEAVKAAWSVLICFALTVLAASFCCLTGPWWTLMGFTGPYCALLCLTRPYFAFV